MTEEIRESYRLLELEPGATLEAVKAAYRELIKVWHPDRFPNDPKFQKRATEKTKALNEAYQKITAYLAGNYTESRTSARARAAEEEARRAREAAEAKQREEAARRAREVAEERAREEARLREQRRRAEEWAKQQAQPNKGSAQGKERPPPLPRNIPGKSKAQQPPKKPTRWMDYIGPALFLAFIMFYNSKCDREKPFDRKKSAAEAGDVSAQRSASGVISPDLQSEPAPARAELKDETPTTQIRPPSPTVAVPQAAKHIVYTFSVGSTKEDVIAVQGKPTEITENALHYGFSRVNFRNGRVVSWDQSSANPLAAKMFPSEYIVNPPEFFTLGSSKAEVVEVQGTPTSFDESYFSYGSSTVFFENGQVVSWTSLTPPLKARRRD